VVMHSLAVIGARAYPETISLDCVLSSFFPSLRCFMVGSFSSFHYAFIFVFLDADLCSRASRSSKRI
jgi:hypothetical protein